MKQLFLLELSQPQPQVQQFPSPCGDLVMKLAIEVSLNTEAITVLTFPSPYGELAMKRISQTVDEYFQDGKGFRPLAGNWL